MPWNGVGLVVGMSSVYCKGCVLAGVKDVPVNSGCCPQLTATCKPLVDGLFTESIVFAKYPSWLVI